jgi:hypothetical protein
MIGIATLINLWVTWKRNMREFALVGAWALIAIAVANKDTHTSIFYVAIITAIIIIISSSVHGYKNKAKSPLIKYKQYKESKV